MNRPRRRLTVARLALSLALVGSAAHAEESPFPASGWYGVVPPAPGGSNYSEESPFPASGWYGVVPAQGTSNYSGRFDTYGSGYGGSYGTRGVGTVLFGAVDLSVRLFPPLLLVMLPVAVAGLVVMGLNSAASEATNAELAALPHQADGASQESTRE